MTAVEIANKPAAPGAITASVVHVVHSIGQRSFGLGSVAANLAKHQLEARCHTRIWCLDSPAEANAACQGWALPAETVKGFPRVGPSQLCFSPDMRHAARERDTASAVLHLHGIWTSLSGISNTWRRNRRMPTLVAAHGSLDPFALKISTWKKRIAWFGYERSNLVGATCLHALTAAEAQDYRNFGLRNPIAVLPNGISQAWASDDARPTALRRQLGIPDETRILLYLSRITPKKGLLNLVRALSDVRPHLKDWAVVIAGVDENGHQAQVEAEATRLGVEKFVFFPGPLFGREKRDAFAAAQVFVLPSFSEGFPMVILEALGAGVPVLATTASPIAELASGDYGWCTAPARDAIAAALRDAFSRSDDALRQIGLRGQEMVCARYNWKEIANRSIDLYEWLLGKKPRPDFVLTD